MVVIFGYAVVAVVDICFVGTCLVGGMTVVGGCVVGIFVFLLVMPSLLVVLSWLISLLLLPLLVA